MDSFPLWRAKKPAPNLIGRIDDWFLFLCGLQIHLDRLFFSAIYYWSRGTCIRWRLFMASHLNAFFMNADAGIEVYVFYYLFTFKTCLLWYSPYGRNPIVNTVRSVYVD